MKNYVVAFCLVCCLFCLLYAHYKLESRLDQLSQQLEQHNQQKTICANWVGACKMKEPRKNAALYLHGRNPVIQIMDGQYHIANFAITIHNGEVVMQLIQGGEVRLKKLWELTDESDFVRSVGGVE